MTFEEAQEPFPRKSFFTQINNIKGTDKEDYFEDINKRPESPSNLPLNDIENFDFLFDESPVKECFICGWIYPKVMSSEEKNTHANLCLEGSGLDHKDNYLKDLQQVIDLTQNEQEKDELAPIESCPHCGKRFKLKTKNLKERHIIDCAREIEEFNEREGRKRRVVKPTSY